MVYEVNSQFFRRSFFFPPKKGNNDSKHLDSLKIFIVRSIFLLCNSYCIRYTCIQILHMYLQNLSFPLSHTHNCRSPTKKKKKQTRPYNILRAHQNKKSITESQLVVIILQK